MGNFARARVRAIHVAFIALITAASAACSLMPGSKPEEPAAKPANATAGCTTREQATMSLMLLAQDNGKATSECLGQYIAAHPDDAEVRAMRSSVLLVKGDAKSALADMNEAVRLAPNNASMYSSRGVVYAGLDDSAHAIEDFSKAIELEPGNAKAYANRGQLYLQLGKVDAALADFNRAIEIEPRDDDFHAARGMAFVQGDALLLAQADLDDAVRLNPKKASHLGTRGQVYQARGMYSEARADYLEAIRLEPKKSTGYNNLSWLLSTAPSAADRNGADAVRYGEKAVEISGGDNPAELDTLANAYAENGQFAEAAKTEQKALEVLQAQGAAAERLARYRDRIALYQGSKNFRLTAADVQKMAPLGRCDTTDMARRAGEAGRYAIAVDCLGNHLKQVPGDADAWRMRADAYAELHDADHALADWAKALKLAPKDVKTYNDRGAFYLTQAQDYDKALADYTSAIAIDPKNADLRNSRGTVHLSRGEQDAAIADYTEAFALGSKSATAHHLRGTAYQQLGKLELAIADYDAAQQLQPDSRVQFQRGVAYANLNRLNEGLADFDAILARNPRHAGAHKWRGIVYLRKQDPAHGLPELDEALKLEPDNVDTVLVRGDARMGTHDLAGAAADYQRAVALSPDSPIAHLSYAWIRATAPDAQLRNGTEALQHAQRACELSQWKLRRAVSTLAAAYAENGKYDDAIKYQKQALQLAEGHETSDVMQLLRDRLKTYEGQQPFRSP